MSTEIICKDCGAIIDVENEYYIEIDGEYVCKDCMDDYVQCGDCGEWHNIENCYWIESESTYVCEDCLDNNFVRCEDCDEYVRQDEAYLVTSIYDSDYYICEHCRDNGNYGVCDSCGDLFHIDDLRYHEGHGCDYCESCYPCNENIMDYHDFDDWQEYTINDKNESILKGFELEVSGDDCDYVAGLVKDILGDFAVYEEDGSICGFEIITNPFSRQYWDKNSEDFKKALDVLKTKKYENVNCGLHVHVNREQLETEDLSSEDVIDNIILIMETFKNELTKFSRRTNSDLARWASFLTDDGEELIFEELKKKKSRKGRYCALNITNSDTVEFRIFKGTLEYDELMATLELVDNIVDIARSNKLEGLTWNDIVSFGGSFIGQYVNDYGIASDKKLHIVKAEEKNENENYLYKDFKVGDIVTIKKEYDKIGFEHSEKCLKYTIIHIYNGDNVLIYNPKLKGHSASFYDYKCKKEEHKGHLWFVHKSWLKHVVEEIHSVDELNIGDRVIIRDDLVVGCRYGDDSFVNRMIKGGIVTITEKYCFKFRIKEGRYYYTPEMCVGKIAHENISL